MTLAQAERILLAVDLVRKRKSSGWQWEHVGVEDGVGTALATVAAHVDPRSMVRWFSSATANVHKIEDAGQGWWRVYFTLAEVGR